MIESSTAPTSARTIFRSKRQSPCRDVDVAGMKMEKQKAVSSHRTPKVLALSFDVEKCRISGGAFTKTVFVGRDS